MPISREEFDAAPRSLPMAEWERELRVEIGEALARGVARSAGATTGDPLAHMAGLIHGIYEEISWSVCDWARNRRGEL